MLVFVALSVLFTLDLASADWTMKVICDDQMKLWIDGVLTEVGGQGVWNQMSTLDIPENTRSIGIQCKNTGGPYGITGSVQDADGNDILVTDNSWGCSNTADEGWEGPDFVEGDNWNAASYYAHRNYVVHNSGPWREMSPNKQIIWTGTAADTTVYCRKSLPGNSFSGRPSTSLSGMAVKDTVSYTAIYSASAERFGLNIKDEAGTYMFRLAFRLPTDPTGSGPISVMNSREDGEWGTELRAAFPALEDGKAFTVTVVCLGDKFVADFNGVRMPGVEFPYRYDLSNAAEFELWGGAGMGDDGVPIRWIKINNAVAGGWSDYGDWSDCSVEDGGAGGLDGGTSSRSRTCDNPAPANGGAACEGDAVETRSCPTLGGVNWVPFAVSQQAVISTDFSDQLMERFYVKYPCQDSIWFKLFLRRDDGANSHVEIYSKVKGNIYCNGAGARNWYDGQKTDFTMAAGAMKCEAGDKSLIIVVEKTADRVTIKNRGQVLYNQAFTANDANCRQATTTVKTQVWNYGGWLDLGVFDNSAPLNLAQQSSCFVQDFDYGQSDIKKITKVDSAESCLAQCGKQIGCQSMAFVPGNGDCWLKNLLYGQNPKPKVGVISANLACQVPRLMTENCVKTNFDYWGADIKKVGGVSSLLDCANECSKTEGGKSVAFVPGSGDCWVKFLENGARPEAKDGVDSVAVSCLAGVSDKITGAKAGCGERCVDKGVDYWGADIKNVNPVYTIEECTARCYAQDGCVSITHRPSTQDCWLKNKPNGQNGKSFLDTVNSINMNCFLLAHPATPGCVKENYDFRGADIRMVNNVLNVEDCAALCGDEAGCVSVTHQPSTSRCWLKNKRYGADPQDMDGVSSRNIKCGDDWCEHAKSFLYTYANAPIKKFDSLEEAKKACVGNGSCNGITYEPKHSKKYTLRRGPTIHDWSPTNETSWTLC